MYKNWGIKYLEEWEKDLKKKNLLKWTEWHSDKNPEVFFFFKIKFKILKYIFYK